MDIKHIDFDEIFKNKEQRVADEMLSKHQRGRLGELEEDLLAVGAEIKEIAEERKIAKVAMEEAEQRFKEKDEELDNAVARRKRIRDKMRVVREDW